MPKSMRAWFVHDIGAGFPMKFELVIDPDRSAKFVYTDPNSNDDWGKWEYPSTILCDDDWIFEYGTGRSDFQNKEIFEGDIVQCTHDREFWSDGIGDFKKLIKKGIVWYSVEKCAYVIWDGITESYFLEDVTYEIIGDKWNNLELVEEINELHRQYATFES